MKDNAEAVVSLLSGVSRVYVSEAAFAQDLSECGKQKLTCLRSQL